MTFGQTKRIWLGQVQKNQTLAVFLPEVPDDSGMDIPAKNHTTCFATFKSECVVSCLH